MYLIKKVFNNVKNVFKKKKKKTTTPSINRKCTLIKKAFSNIKKLQHQVLTENVPLLKMHLTILKKIQKPHQKRTSYHLCYLAGTINVPLSKMDLKIQ